MVNWSVVTTPKQKGGQARQANIVLLDKIGGQLVAGTDTLWARVFHAKYVKNQPMLDCVARPTDSTTWKGIVKSLAYVHGGFSWRIGNGCSVSLWFDACVTEDPLCLLVEEIDPDEIL